MTTTQPKRQPIPFGKYLLLDRINIGGMAEVWRGKMFGAGGFERLVAIKRILPNIAEDDEFIQMFIDEAKISVQLNHANIAKIEELGQIANNYFIAMEYIPGKDMRAIFDRCRKKGEPAPIPLVAFVVSKMCEGLDYAHRKKDGMGRDLKIVHRDISPQNVLISFEGEVKVIDFGIAKAASKATRTQAGILKGKFGYMSPEQIRGMELDGRSDIFAIGVCLYEMLTGERLFVGDSDFSVLEKVRKAEVEPPSTYNRRIPEALEKIVLKALARDVDERYQYANELGDDLQRFLLTSDILFGRKDLMQYMKSTFAEDVEREKLRLQEYSEIEPPPGMLSAAELGNSGVPPAPSAPPPSPGPVRRTSTLTALPKLTAAAAAPPPADDESGATIMMTSGELFDDPTTQPGAQGPGRTVTPVEVPRAPVVDAQPPQRTPSLRMPSVASPPAPRIPASPPVSAESTTVARQGRNTLDGIPRVSRPEPSESPPSVVPRPSLTEMPVVRHSPPPPQPPAAAPVLAAAPPVARPNRTPLIAALAALVVLLVGVGLFFALRPEPSGFLLVQLPQEVKGKAQVFINGEDMGSPGSGLVLRPVPAGPAVVQVTAEGYAPFSLPVQIASGTTPTQVEVKLERTVRLTRLVVVTQPLDAELSVDGKVVRQKGSTSTYMSEVEVGTEVVVAARAPGFKPLEKRVTPENESPVDLQLKLESDEYDVKVESEPSGATIFAGGRTWGTTPTQVRLPSSVKQVSLKLKCHEEVSVNVAPDAGGSAVVNKALKKKRERGCR